MKRGHVLMKPRERGNPRRKGEASEQQVKDRLSLIEAGGSDIGGGLNGGSSLTARDLPALVNKGDSHEAFQQPDRNRNRTPSYRKGWDLIPMFYAKDSKGNEYKGKSLRYDYMSCLNCRKWGDHWTIYCPNKAEEAPKSERKRKRKRKLKHKHKRKRQESTCDNTSGAKVGLGSQTDKLC
ncbi:hypothetical protein M0R45_005028 [Rubus argutus]|uniref:Uncharacterized protein n=1 Tax=Rubus argutus TaxID=59490 RepID=A0AAW1YM27_RUBAR